MYSIEFSNEYQIIFPYYFSQTDVICSNNDKYIVTADIYEQITIWEKETLLPITVIKKYKHINDVLIAKTEPVIIICCNLSYGVYIYNFITKEEKFLLLHEYIKKGLFLKNNNLILVGFMQIYVVDYRTKTIVKTLNKEVGSYPLDLIANDSNSSFILITDYTKDANINKQTKIVLNFYNLITNKIIESLVYEASIKIAEKYVNSFSINDSLIIEFNDFYEEFIISTGEYKQHPKDPLVNPEIVLKLSDNNLKKITWHNMEYTIYHDSARRGNLFNNEYLLERNYGFVYEKNYISNRKKYRGVKPSLFSENESVEYMFTDRYIIFRKGIIYYGIYDILTNTEVFLGTEKEVFGINIDSELQILWYYNAKEREIICTKLDENKILYRIPFTKKHCKVNYHYDKRNNTIVILFENHTVSIYNAINGEFIREFGIDECLLDMEGVTKFQQIDNNRMAFCNRYDFSIIIGSVSVCLKSFEVKIANKNSYLYLYDICYIPDSNLIVVAMRSGYLKIVDASYGAEIKTVRVAKTAITCLALSPNNEQLYIAVEYEGIQILCPKTFESLQEIRLHIPISSIKFSSRKKGYAIINESNSFMFNSYSVCTFIDIKTMTIAGKLIFSTNDNFGFFMSAYKYEVTKLFMRNVNMSKLCEVVDAKTFTAKSQEGLFRDFWLK